MHIGEKIQALRKEHDISQEQLAEKLFVSRQAISKWETGESMPDVDNIVRLSSIFNVSTDYLLNATQGQGSTVIHNYGPAPTQVNMNINTEVTEDDDYEDYDDRPVRRIIGITDFSFQFGGVIFPLALLVFLVIRFWFDGGWRGAWIVFPIAWFIEVVINFVRSGKLDVSISGIAVAVYLILGIGWGLWHPGWIVIVVAWVLSEAIQVGRPKRRRKRRRRKD